jgi:hypothetical protein
MTNTVKKNANKKDEVPHLELSSDESETESADKFTSITKTMKHKTSLKDGQTIKITAQDDQNLQMLQVPQPTVTCTKSLNDLKDNTDPITQQYKLITEQVLLQNKKKDDEQTANQVQKIDIAEVRSNHILKMELTPFTNEDELPPFPHGSSALYYFQILRSILSKYTRATIHSENLLRNKERNQIPRGLRINKTLIAVDPTHHLKLNYMTILGEAENKIMNGAVMYLMPF